MTDSNFAELKAACNAALTTLDMDYARRMLPGVSCDDVLLVAMHQARYECTEIADELRRESEGWLKNRGFKRCYGAEFPVDGHLPE